MKLYKAVRLGLEVLGWSEGEVRAEHREKAATLALDAALKTSASKSSIQRFVITEKAPTFLSHLRHY